MLSNGAAEGMGTERAGHTAVPAPQLVQLPSLISFWTAMGAFALESGFNDRHVWTMSALAWHTSAKGR
jgi:hypothetical protein